MVKEKRYESFYYYHNNAAIIRYNKWFRVSGFTYGIPFQEIVIFLKTTAAEVA
jgi:hypothetical protein